jgi:NCS1 family nucleobase:cation symporter-1
MGKVRDMFRWAEVKERTDIYTHDGTTKWGNHDLYPIDQKEKEFGYMAYAVYWATSGMGLFTYTIGSSYIALGLNAGETIGACIIGSFISALIGLAGARPGQDYGIGYVCRFSLLLVEKL